MDVISPTQNTGDSPDFRPVYSPDLFSEKRMRKHKKRLQEKYEVPFSLTSGRTVVFPSLTALFDPFNKDESFFTKILIPRPEQLLTEVCTNYEVHFSGQSELKDAHWNLMSRIKQGGQTHFLYFFTNYGWVHIWNYTWNPFSCICTKYASEYVCIQAEQMPGIISPADCSWDYTGRYGKIRVTEDCLDFGRESN